MQIAPEIINEFISNKEIDLADFDEWFNDAGYPQDEGNVYDSRYLQHLENYVAQRIERRHD